MCSLCAALGAGRDWTDAAGREEFRRHGGKVNLRNEREARVALLDRLLGAYGITVKDWGGNSYVLENRDGQRRNVYNLGGIWAAMETLRGKACDPLDQDFMERLTRSLETRE